MLIIAIYIINNTKYTFIINFSDERNEYYLSKIIYYEIVLINRLLSFNNIFYKLKIYSILVSNIDN